MCQQSQDILAWLVEGLKARVQGCIHSQCSICKEACTATAPGRGNRSQQDLRNTCEQNRRKKNDPISNQRFVGLVWQQLPVEMMHEASKRLLKHLKGIFAPSPSPLHPVLLLLSFLLAFPPLLLRSVSMTSRLALARFLPASLCLRLALSVPSPPLSLPRPVPS